MQKLAIAENALKNKKPFLMKTIYCSLWFGYINILLGVYGQASTLKINIGTICIHCASVIISILYGLLPKIRHWLVVQTFLKTGELLATVLFVGLRVRLILTIWFLCLALHKLRLWSKSKGFQELHLVENYNG